MPINHKRGLVILSTLTASVLAPWMLLHLTTLPGTSQARSGISAIDTKMQVALPKSLTSAKVQVPTLTEIAYQYASVQRSAEALPMLDRTRELVKTHVDACGQATLLMRVAHGYVLAGETAKGQQLLKQALETARVQTIANCRLSATSPQESLLNRAAEYAESAQYDWAMAIVEGVDNRVRPMTLTRIALSHWKAQQPEKAQSAIARAIALNRSLPDPDMRRQILTVMAVQLKQMGAVELLPPVMEQILQATIAIPAPANSTQPSDDQAFLQLGQQMILAELWMYSGDNARAITVLDQTVPQIQSLRSSDSIEPIRALAQAAVHYAAAGQPQRAEAVMALALIRAKALKSGARAAIGVVAQGYAELGQTERALKLAPVESREDVNATIALRHAKDGKIDQAVTVARSLKTRQEMTLSLIVNQLLQANQDELALQIAKAEKMSGTLPQVALAFAQAGKPQVALQIAQSIKAKDPSRQAIHLDWLMPAIVTAFAQEGQLDQALQVAQQIKTPMNQSQALTAVADHYIKADRIANQRQATETLDQALKVALLIR